MKIDGVPCTSEEILVKYGIDWRNRKPNERLADAIDEYIWKKLKSSDTTSEVGYDVLKYTLAGAALNRKREFWLTDCSKFLPAETSAYPRFLLDRIEFKIEPSKGFNLNIEAFDLNGFVESIVKEMKDKKINKSELRELEEWIPGCTLKLIFQKEAVKKAIAEKIVLLAREVKYNLTASMHFQQTLSAGFYDELAAVLQEEMIQKHSLIPKTVARFKAFFSA